MQFLRCPNTASCPEEALASHLAPHAGQGFADGSQDFLGFRSAPPWVDSVRARTSPTLPSTAPSLRPEGDKACLGRPASCEAHGIERWDSFTERLLFHRPYAIAPEGYLLSEKQASVRLETRNGKNVRVILYSNEPPSNRTSTSRCIRRYGQRARQVVCVCPLSSVGGRLIRVLSPILTPSSSATKAHHVPFAQRLGR